MGLKYFERLENVRSIINELYEIISSGYQKINGYAAAFVFNNLFEECWKLMKDLLQVYYGLSGDDERLAGPKKVIRSAYEHHLIESERWLKIVTDRNNTVHDYRSQNMEYYYERIKEEYVILVEELIKKADAIHKELLAEK